MSHGTYGSWYTWVMAHPSYGTCESCLTHTNESWHIWVIPHTHQKWVTYESCLTYEWVTSHIWMSHVSHMNESRLTYEWVTSDIWMSHVSHMDVSFLAHEKHIALTHRIFWRQNCYLNLIPNLLILWGARTCVCVWREGGGRKRTPAREEGRSIGGAYSSTLNIVWWFI